MLLRRKKNIGLSRFIVIIDKVVGKVVKMYTPYFEERTRTICMREFYSSNCISISTLVYSVTFILYLNSLSVRLSIISFFSCLL